MSGDLRGQPKVIIQKRNILTYEFRGNVIINHLYVFYNKDESYKFLSPELKFSLPKEDTDAFEAKKKRAVVDYISDMMDTFAIKNGKRID